MAHPLVKYSPDQFELDLLVSGYFAEFQFTVIWLPGGTVLPPGANLPE
jgi:hypothetical protein